MWRAASAGLLLFAMPTVLTSSAGLGVDESEWLQTITQRDRTRESAIKGVHARPNRASLTSGHGLDRERRRDVIVEGVTCIDRCAAPGAEAMLVGIATVIDADTLLVNGTSVRLIGIDAPEGRQPCQSGGQDWPCGLLATAAVHQLIGAAPVDCEVYGRDRWDRALAVCRQGGLDINAEIVRAGWALAWYPENGAVAGPGYEREQREAELKAAGIWEGRFVDPWIWRRSH